MNKTFLALLSLIASVGVQAAENGSTARFVCTGNTNEYIDGKGPTVQATSINLSITPKTGSVQIDKTWGCKASDDLCKSFTMSNQKDKYSFSKSESNSDFDSQVSVVFYAASAKLATSFVRNYKPPSKKSKKKPLVNWSSQRFTSELKCKGVKNFD